MGDDDDNRELLVLGNVSVDGRTEAALLCDEKMAGEEETTLNAIEIVRYHSNCFSFHLVGK